MAPKKKAPAKLTDILLREVSFVDSPANPHATVVLAKRDEVNKDGPGVGDVHVAGTNITGVKMKKCPTSGCDLPMEGGACPEHGKVGKGLFAKLLEGLGITSSGDTVEDLTKLNETVLSFEKDDSPDDEDDDDVDKLITDAGSSGDEKIKKGKEMPANKDDVLKGLTPEQREAIEKATKEAVEKATADVKAEAEKVALAKSAVDKTEIEKANGEVAKVNARIEKLENERKDEARLVVAKGLVVKSGIPADAVSNILKQLDEEGTKQFKDILSKTDKFADDSKAFAELGKDYQSSSTTDAVQIKAAELRKADPKLSAEAAVAKVYEAHPELYDAVNKGE